MKKNIFISLAFLFILSNGFSQKEKKISFFKTSSKVIYDICFTPKGEAIGIADNKTIKVYTIATKALLKEFKDGHQNRIMSIDISKDNKLLVSGDNKGKIVIWDYLNNKILKTLNSQNGLITSLKISPDCRYIASGGTDHKVFLYDVESNKVIHEFADHLAEVTSVEFSPDGKLIVSAGGDKTIKIYDTKSYELIKSLTGHDSWVRGISFSKDGKKMISCGDDANLIIWDMSKIQDIYQQSKVNSKYSWLSSVQYNEYDNEAYVYADISGKIAITTLKGGYNTNLHVLINKIRFIHTESIYFRLAVATKGRGVMYLNARNMHSTL